MQLAQKYKENDLFKVIHKYHLEDFIEFSKTVKVLFVDKEDEKRDDYYSIFKIFFHEIDVASNGEEAFELFQKNKYDLVITAIDMPVMGGLELITKIREISRHITVLIHSSKKKHFIEFIRLGVDGYILKPIEVEQFVHTIYRVIKTLHNKQALYEYRIELEEKVQQKTQELQKINTSLEEKVKEEVEKNLEHEKHLHNQAKLVSMGEMIGNIAHQWRQPLSFIATAATGMRVKKEMEMLEDHEFYEYCDKINENAQYLSQTIDDFRNFVKGDMEQVCFNLKQDTDSFIKLVDSLIKQFNILVILDLEEDIDVQGYPNELIQCFMNIFNNSKDAFIINKISEDERFVFISQKIQENQIIIKFKDSAGGIPDDVLPRIFDPYFTTKHKSQGTGLGLHMSYNFIVNGMKGTFKAENSVYEFNKKTYKGALFTITLPLIHPE